MQGGIQQRLHAALPEHGMYVPSSLRLYFLPLVIPPAHPHRVALSPHPTAPFARRPRAGPSPAYLSRSKLHPSVEKGSCPPCANGASTHSASPGRARTHTPTCARTHARSHAHGAACARKRTHARNPPAHERMLKDVHRPQVCRHRLAYEAQPGWWDPKNHDKVDASQRVETSLPDRYTRQKPW